MSPSRASAIARWWIPAACVAWGVLVVAGLTLLWQYKSGAGESAELAPLTTGNAIEFNWEDSGQFASFLTTLLDNLSGSSDFQLVWPGRSVVCVVHHHKQLWWTTPDAAIHRELEILSQAFATPATGGG